MADTGIAGGSHALLVGEIFGALIRTGLEAKLITEYGDYTNEIRVTKPSGTYIVAVYPENTKED